MIVTPGQLARRADFYHQLGQLTAAGLGLVQALEQLHRAPPSRLYLQPLQRTLDNLNQGYTLSESFVRSGNWLPEFDVTLIEAGEKSGRLVPCFQMLSDFYTERAQTIKRVIVHLAYPAFLVHLIVAVMTLIFYFWLPHYMWFPVVGLLTLYTLTFLLIYSMQSKHGERWRGFVETVLRPIPVIGAGRRSLALGRLAAALEALISAGVMIAEAWELAARASGSPALRRIVNSWKPLLESGQTPAEAINASGQFPPLFANQYATGEISGKLDETLRRLRNYYQDEGSRKIQIVAQWAPIGVYLLVLAAGGAFVVWFWVNYYGRMLNAF